MFLLQYSKCSKGNTEVSKVCFDGLQPKTFSWAYVNSIHHKTKNRNYLPPTCYQLTINVSNDKTEETKKYFIQEMIATPVFKEELPIIKWNKYI